MNIWIKTKGSSFTTDVQTAYLSTDIGSAVEWDRISGQGEVYVDENSQIEYAIHEPDGSATAVVHVTGCTMLTRGNPNV